MTCPIRLPGAADRSKIYSNACQGFVHWQASGDMCLGFDAFLAIRESFGSSELVASAVGARPGR